MSNLELSERGAKLTATELERYLVGFRGDDGKPRDIGDLLADPKAVLTVQVSVPPDATLYGSLAGTSFSIPYYVAYPTTAENTRDSYLFPHEKAYQPTFVHMERASDAPLPATTRSKYPLILSSHGYSTHVIWDVNRAKVLASHGFVVVLPFHGDNRFMPLNAAQLAIRALRPLAAKAVLDHLLTETGYATFIDTERMGVTGHSLGALTALGLMGARVGLHEGSTRDPRIRAGIGVVPYVGSDEGGGFYQFGPKNIGLRAVTKPFLGIYGSADTVAIPRYVLPAIEQLAGPRYAVEFVDQPHVFTGDFWSDRENWELLFFRAYLQDAPESMTLLQKADAIAGFGEDHQRFEYQKLGPVPS